MKYPSNNVTLSDLAPQTKDYLSNEQTAQHPDRSQQTVSNTAKIKETK